MPVAHEVLQMAGLAVLCATSAYQMLAIAALLWWGWRRPEDGTAPMEAVSVLKPLCGAEPGLYQQLRSFCVQDHPAYEIVFGIRDATDPARLTVERLVAEFPGLALTLVIDPQQHGSNLKTSNLINMLHRAQHGIVVISDSDARVGPDYLTRVTAPLRNPGVGLVTSLYRAIPTPDLWSRLCAMYINEWYMPSVLLARMFGHRGYVSGQTMCLRRQTLECNGGLEALADHLAEDHRFGECVRELGLEIIISSYPVTCTQHESTLHSLLQHELRWLRTLRALTPRSFCWLFTTFSLPLGLVGAGCVLFAGSAPRIDTAAITLLGVVAFARLALYGLHRQGSVRERLADLWLVPVRDLLLVWSWARAFASDRVTWGGREYTVDPGGLLRHVPGTGQPRPAANTEHLLN